MVPIKAVEGADLSHEVKRQAVHEGFQWKIKALFHVGADQLHNGLRPKTEGTGHVVVMPVVTPSA